MTDHTTHNAQNLRPLLHFTALKNWLNDPNGLSYYRGKYHLFYQYNPKGLEWGNMSWGHATSEDLLHWEHLPIAMIQDQDYDRDGVFSGSAIVYQGEHYVYYTGVAQEEKGLKQVQCLATSKDGINYLKYENNPILEGSEHANAYDFRDPKVWLYDNRMYLIVATNDENKGKANLYVSTNGIDFEYDREFFRPNMGYMWECPDLFQVDKQWLLIYSAMGVGQDMKQNTAFISKVDFEYDKRETYVDEPERMDYGDDFYAPQTIGNEKERRIMIAWLRMIKPLDDSHPWTGMMTLPREIFIENGQIMYRVIEEIYANTKGYITKNLHAKHHHQIQLNDAYLFECTLSFDHTTDLQLTTPKESGLSISYKSQMRRVYLVRNLHGVETIYESPIIDTDVITLQIFLDKSVAEIFINHGRHVLTAVYYQPTKTLEINVSKDIETFEYRFLS